MENKKRKEKVQSRREFFKKAASKTLPILGAIVLSSIPFVSSAKRNANGCDWGCADSCLTGCTTSCYTSCRGTCSGYCRGTCSTACNLSCGVGCSGTCYHGCSGVAKY